MKLNKKAITLLVLATLLMSMIPIMPASAATVELISAGDGAATWSTTQANTGDWSVELDAGTLGGSNAGRIYIPITPILLSDLATDPTFWYWEPTGAAHGGTYPAGGGHDPYGTPYYNIYLDFNGDGIYDDYLEGLGSLDSGGSLPSAETWTEMEEGYGYYDMDDSMGSAYGGWPIVVGTLEQWKAHLITTEPAAEVIGIKITFGYWAGEVTNLVYVDDVTIAGVTYDLEGLIADHGGPYTETGAVTFDGSGSITEGDGIETYSWSFGDGTGTQLGEEVIHTYASTGVYTVTLTVTDAPLTHVVTTTATIIAKSGLSADRITVENKKASMGATGEKGNKIITIGADDSVASGSSVSVYWDKIQTWDGEDGLLNTTGVDDDGGFELWFKVPEAVEGDHNVWFKESDGLTTARKELEVIPDLDVSRSSGLAGDKVYVDLWGFAKSKDVSVLLMEAEGTLLLPTVPAMDTWGKFEAGAPDENIVKYDSEEDEYDDTLVNGMIEPGTVLFTADNGQFYDDFYANGKLYNEPFDKVGTINYVTGEWTLDFEGTTAANLPDDDDYIDADYTYIKSDTLTVDVLDPDSITILASSGETDVLGTWDNRRVTIPSGADDDVYYLVAMDGKGNTASAKFTVGAVIYLSSDEGPVGEEITIEGEGFGDTEWITVKLDRGTENIGVHIIDSQNIVGKMDSLTNAEGEFSFEVIIPQGAKIDDDYEIIVTGGTSTKTAKADYEITALAEITVTPDFGPQGSSITITGINFPNVKGTEVSLTLTNTAGTTTVANIDDVETNSDGTFSIKTTVPTQPDDNYKVKADTDDDTDGAFNIDDSATFRIGTIMVLLSKDESVVGDLIVFTGNGFTKNKEWNATFGDVEIFVEKNIDSNGLLKDGNDIPQFFVPQLPVGEYTITVWDEYAEIKLETEFEITEYTVLEYATLQAPNDYNVTMDGWNWPEVDGDINTVDEISFTLWNATDGVLDEDWDMDVRQMQHNAVGTTPATSETAVVNATGFFNDAYWVVLDDDTLSVGTYTINATIETTNDQEYTMQHTFVVGAEYLSMSPRKALFRIGDTVSFKIEHSFGSSKTGQVRNGVVKIYDPSGDLYWKTEGLTSWTKTGMWYTASYSGQTSGDNPMVLLDDAPTGTWTYKWYENDGNGALTGDEDLLAEGTFAVEASAESVVSGEIASLAADIVDLVGQLEDVSDLVGDVSGEFESVRSDIANVATLATAAADAAITAAEAVTAVAETANTASEAAADAATAAEAARDAATGLTSLVYGAIAASLVAALAAIVSLMQISRRIAG